MSLDFAKCDRARLARDPVYDGRFLAGRMGRGTNSPPQFGQRP
jgi:hypothetical protein